MVLVGGSIAAYPRGGFADFLAAACPGVEIVNLSKSKLGVGALRRRFEDLALTRPLSPGVERWLMFNGGLNSIANPRLVLRELGKMFSEAHRRGWKVLALSVTPWGSESSRYWRGLAGLGMVEGMERVVAALGDPSAWTRYPDSAPDRWVDLLHGDLRYKDAPPRDIGPLLRALERDRRWSRRLRGLRGEARKQAALEIATRAAEVPTYHLAPRYRSFDSTHPNREGHRVIAELVCPHMPEAARCDCEAMGRMVWDGERRCVVTASAPEGEGPPEAR